MPGAGHRPPAACYNFCRAAPNKPEEVLLALIDNLISARQRRSLSNCASPMAASRPADGTGRSLAWRCLDGAIPLCRRSSSASNSPDTTQTAGQSWEGTCPARCLGASARRKSPPATRTLAARPRPHGDRQLAVMCALRRRSDRPSPRAQGFAFYRRRPGRPVIAAPSPGGHSLPHPNGPWESCWSRCLGADGGADPFEFHRELLSLHKAIRTCR